MRIKGQLNINKQHFSPNRSLVCAGTGRRATQGLTKRHAYSVFGVLEEDEATDRPRLIKLRNPWGRGEEGEWSGAWGKEWLRRNRKECRELETGPGEFFMDLRDFLEHFSLLTFCLNLSLKWTEEKRKSELTPHSGKMEYRLELEERADTMISFSQIGRRQLRDVTGPAATFLNIRLSLLDSTDEEEFAGVQYGQLRTTTLRKILTAGSYRIVCEAEEVDRNTPTFLRVASLCQTFSLTH